MSCVVRANRFILFYLIYQILTQLFLGTPNDIIFKYLIGYLVPIFVYFVFSHKKISEVFFIKKLDVKKYFFIVLFALAVQPIMLVISMISSMFAKNLINDLIPVLFSSSPLLMFNSLALMPAVLEESIFRGVIFSDHKSIEPKKLFFINGLIFGAAHLNFQQLLYTTIMGTIFCALVYFTQSILSSIVAHFVFNATQLSLVYLSRVGSFKNFFVFSSNNSFFGILLFIFLVIISATISVLLFKKIIKEYDTNENQDCQREKQEEEKSEEPKTLKVFTPCLITYFVLSLIIMCLVSVFY